MRTKNDSVDIRCHILRETEKAIQVEIDDTCPHPHLDAGKYWFPLSQTHEIHRVAFKEGSDRLVVSKWIMEQKINEVLAAK